MFQGDFEFIGEAIVRRSDGNYRRRMPENTLKERGDLWSKVKKYENWTTDYRQHRNLINR